MSEESKELLVVDFKTVQNLVYTIRGQQDFHHIFVDGSTKEIILTVRSDPVKKEKRKKRVG